jgi:hypothetical protein
MADDRLELIASVKNLTSGPLKDIQRSMRALAADTTASHKLGVVLFLASRGRRRSEEMQATRTSPVATRGRCGDGCLIYRTRAAAPCRLLSERRTVDRIHCSAAAACRRARRKPAG